MANDLNQCNFIGRLGKDPEIRYSASGQAIASFSIAVSSSWTDKQSGQKKERTEWVNCSAFGRMAEVVGEYVKKGSKLFVSGEQCTDKWQDQQGQDRYTTKINVRQMQMLDSKQASGATGSPQNAAAQSQQPAGGFNQQQGGWNQQQAPQQSAPQQFNEPPFDPDQDIPF